MCHSARRLIQSNLDHEQNKLVQAVLENGLLVQANLQDAAPSDIVPGRTGGEPPQAQPSQLPKLDEAI
jgi:hypothetical protein